jgi:hypothetical protein
VPAELASRALEDPAVARIVEVFRGKIVEFTPSNA